MSGRLGGSGADRARREAVIGLNHNYVMGAHSSSKDGRKRALALLPSTPLRRDEKDVDARDIP